METYNGYANYETWLISVWIDNEQDSIDSVSYTHLTLPTKA